METDSREMGEGKPLSAAVFQLRRETLQARVNEAAKALYERGIRPTVARVRAALGGGSPNDLAPAVKHWREGVLPGLPLAPGSGGGSGAALPLQIADLVYELWQRAMAAALVEVRGGPTAREVAARSAESQELRQQLASLRDQLQRESLAYGELRARAARHEAIGRAALARAHESEVRERDLLRELGALRQRVLELETAAELQAPMQPTGSRAGQKRRGRNGRRAKSGRQVGGRIAKRRGRGKPDPAPQGRSRRSSSSRRSRRTGR